MSGTENANLDLIVCSDSSAKTGVCNKLAEDMASIGLQITVRELTWSEYITALEEGDFDMYYGEVKLRNNFDLTELLDPDSSLNYTRSTDQSFETYINSYLGGYDDADRKTLYASMFDYVASRGGLISIGFETQELIVHRGMIRGLDPNLGNPLYDFANWEIYLDEE
jgi:ABC-type transport system substrate-binding protein